MIRALAFSVLSVLVGAAVAAALASHATEVGGVAIPWICAAIAFGVQWLAFVPATILRTERFYDLVGSLTYLAVVATALALSGARDPRSLLLAALVAFWALRLGTYLFRRALAHGDSRFDEIKQSVWKFLIAWTVQGLWVLLTAAAAIAGIGAEDGPPLGALDLIGVLVWGFGFAIESIADYQKSRHRSRHPGEFISTGLWAWSRHPNYFGEIVLWVGVALVATPALVGWQYVAWISPIFVTLLLTRISGIPMLEEKGEERYGDDPAYRAYVAATPVLVPRPPRASVSAP